MKYFHNLSSISYYLKSNIYNLDLGLSSPSVVNKYTKYKLYTLPTIRDNLISLRLEEYKTDGFTKSIGIGKAKPEPIGAIDLIKYDRERLISIDWFFIYDKIVANENNEAFGKPINQIKADIVANIIFNFAIDYGVAHKYNKIELDVPKNLNQYKQYKLNEFGFYLPEKITSNKYSITTEKYLD
jgi:hypothetical protein